MLILIKLSYVFFLAYLSKFFLVSLQKKLKILEGKVFYWYLLLILIFFFSSEISFCENELTPEELRIKGIQAECDSHLPQDPRNLFERNAYTIMKVSFLIAYTLAFYGDWLFYKEGPPFHGESPVYLHYIFFPRKPE